MRISDWSSDVCSSDLLALPILRLLSQGGGSRLPPLLQIAEHQDNDMLDQILQHLTALVSFDTRNPPRRIGVGGIFDYLRAQLSDFRVEVTDHGDGADRKSTRLNSSH